jgi:hypothetical protein
LSIIQINDPDEEDIFYDKIPLNGKRKEFEHLIDQRGVYEMCFELYEGKTPVRVFFHVDYKPLGADGKDTSRVVSKDDVPQLQKDLISIENKIKEISSEIEHAKRQEAYLNRANGNFLSFLFVNFFLFCYFVIFVDSTASRLEWFSYLSIFVLLGTSLWQIIYLRRFFTS